MRGFGGTDAARLSDVSGNVFKSRAREFARFSFLAIFNDRGPMSIFTFLVIPYAAFQQLLKR